MEKAETIKTAAERLQNATKTGVVCEPVRDLLGIEDLDTAYAVQAAIAAKRKAAGAIVVGQKIGLTSKSVQTQLGVDQPDYGLLFNTMEVMNGGEVLWEELMQPKAEAEIAFVLGKDLDGPKIGSADVLSAIDYALVAIEIVGSRIANWNIRITDTIADNASASHFVLGHRPVKLENVDLLDCKMVMTKNGEVVSEGTGSACLGSPINATLWLAKTMARLGTPLKKGDVVLSGALGPMCNAEAGDHFEARIEGLGAVSVNFAQARNA